MSRLLGLVGLAAWRSLSSALLCCMSRTNTIIVFNFWWERTLSGERGREALLLSCLFCGADKHGLAEIARAAERTQQRECWRNLFGEGQLFFYNVARAPRGRRWRGQKSRSSQTRFKQYGKYLGSQLGMQALFVWRRFIASNRMRTQRNLWAMSNSV